MTGVLDDAVEEPAPQYDDDSYYLGIGQAVFLLPDVADATVG
jgi:hypothetical protein